MNNKKIYFFIALFSVLAILSCGNENESQSKTNTNHNNSKSEGSKAITDKDNMKKRMTSNIPTPQHINFTKTIQRPIMYQKGASGGTFIMGEYSGDPKTFNVILASENTSTDLIRRIQISLMNYNEDIGKWYVYPGNRDKGANKSGYDIEITNDNKMILTVYLRNDIYWTDGEKMTAEDWVWFWNNVYTDKFISPAGYNKASVTMEDGHTEIIKTELIDSETFKFIFPRAIAEPELSANFSPMPKHILKPIIDSEGIEALTKLWGVDTPVSELVTNGPWILTKYIHNSSIIFKSNPNFFLKDLWGNQLPYLDKLIINIVPDMSTLYLNFIGKDIDTYYVNNSDFKRIVEKADEKDYTVWNGGLAPDTEFITFNQNIKSDHLKDSPKRNWFIHKEFRQAMSYLIDRKTITNQVFSGLAQPSNTYLSQASSYYNPDVSCDTDYNPDKALKLLSKIGIRDRNGDGKSEDKDGNTIKFEILTNYGNTQREKIMGVIANEWRTYGITANPSPIEFNVLVTKLTQSFDWDCVLISFEGGLYPFDDNLYLSNGSMHLWHPMQTEPVTEWEKEVDKLYREAKYEADKEFRKELIDDMYDILYEEMPLIPLVRKYTFRAVYNEWGNTHWDVWTEVGGKNNIRVFKK